MNFEVENLAYMLVCMQWTVSGDSARVSLGSQLWRREVGHDGAALPTDANRCASDAVIHVCACASVHGHAGGLSQSGRPPWGWGASGLSPREGSPHGTFLSRVSPMRLGRQGPCPFTLLRNRPGEGQGPGWGSEAQPAGEVDDAGSCPGGLGASGLLSPPPQDLLWAASFYSRFLLCYSPFYGLPGALLLFVAVR